MCECVYLNEFVMCVCFVCVSECALLDEMYLFFYHKFEKERNKPVKRIFDIDTTCGCNIKCINRAK